MKPKHNRNLYYHYPTRFVRGGVSNALSLQNSNKTLKDKPVEESDINILISKDTPDGFKDHVKNLLKQLSTLPSGKKLITQYYKMGGKIAFYTSFKLLEKGRDKPENISDKEPVIGISMDAILEDLSSESKIKEIPAYILMGHEMIHAVNNKIPQSSILFREIENIAHEVKFYYDSENGLLGPEKGKRCSNDKSMHGMNSQAYQIINYMSKLEEFATVGLGDPKYPDYPITENILRREAGFPLREDYSGYTPHETHIFLETAMKRLKEFPDQERLKGDFPDTIYYMKEDDRAQARLLYDKTSEYLKLFNVSVVD